MHHSNVLKRLIYEGRSVGIDDAMWLGCNLKDELKVLEDELVDLILLANL